MREFRTGLRYRCDPDERRGLVTSAAGSLALALAIVLLTGEAARAGCTPAAASNVTATCTGATTNQGGGAPGTSVAQDGYGTGAQTGITVNVANGAGTTVNGNRYGIYVADGTVTNNTGASITGGLYGIVTTVGAANITNSGSITGSSYSGIYAQTDATVTNNAGATITGQQGIFANAGAATIINSGNITGSSNIGILAHNDATVTNNSGATITAFLSAINALNANVTNSGSIISTFGEGILAIGDATVTNNAGASITGRTQGIQALFGAANVANSGSIISTSASGIASFSSATVTNNAGASITGQLGISANDAANVTNSGSITGTFSNGIAANTNATVTNNAGASITGAQYGILAGADGSSVFNAGTISGGTAAIQFAGIGNTLTLAPGSVISGNVLGTGSDTFQLGGKGAATFDASQLGPTAQYRGFGTFNKIDASTWTLTGTSTFAGPVNVNGGTLSVNGDITSVSGITVNAGGTLGGNGIVGNTTINAGGTLAPGNSIGLLTVHGSLVFTAASSYMVEVSGVAADRTNVSGAATLAGTVQVTSPTNSFRFNSPYTILTSSGLGGTQFNALTTPAGTTGSLIYSGNNVLLNLASGLGQLSGLNTNQRAVGAALDAAFNANGNSGGLGGIFAGNVAQNLTQASGETATGSQQTTFDAMNLFMGVLTDPFIAGRGDGVSSSSGASQFADENDNANAYADNGKPRSKSERDAYAAIYRKAPPMAETFTERWSVWAAGYGGSQTTDGSAALGSNSTTSRIFGTAVGADYRFSPFTLAGFALAGGGTNFSVNGFGNGRSDLFQAGAFVRHTVGPAYFTAALAYGWQDVTTNRIVTIAGIDQLRARFNANAFSGRIEDGYRFATPWMGLTPYAAAQFTTFDLPAYAEQAIVGANTFALAYSAKSVTAARSEVGVRTDKSWAMPDSIFTLRGRFAWAHDYNTDRSIGATFQTLPGASFVVNGAAQSPDKALTTASAEVKWRSGFSLAGTFEGEFSSNSSSYAGKGVARYQW